MPTKHQYRAAARALDRMAVAIETQQRNPSLQAVSALGQFNMSAINAIKSRICSLTYDLETLADEASK